MTTTLLFGVTLVFGQVAPVQSTALPVAPYSYPGNVQIWPNGQLPGQPTLMNNAGGVYYVATTGNGAVAANGPAATEPSKDDKDKNDKKDDKDDKDKKDKKPEEKPNGFFHGVLKANKDQFDPKEKDKDEEAEPEPEKPRTANPAPFRAPSFPTAEWQGYPNIGVPPTDNGGYSIMQGLYATDWGDFFKDSRIYIYGWVTGSGNYSTSKETNVPASYAIVPNRLELDQAIFRIEREADMVQTDHIDWGFRLTGLYGLDYRYTTAGGYGSEQLLNHNLEYGFDPLEIYGEIYIPGIFDGLNIRLGRYISPPDIEAQLAPDNYLASHSILFTYDNYTQTGILNTLKLSNQWMVQVGLNAGGDMAPWYKGAIATGFLGARWISADNNDSVYTCWNDINNAKYRQFDTNGIPSGHDNYNYVVSTWSHRFNDKFITTTEAYYMYEWDAPRGGTPSIGPVKPIGGGGGEGPIHLGLSDAYGLVNYTAFQVSKQDYITVRNEWWDDQQGERSGFATAYSSHTIGISHNFNNYLQVRPEIGYYHSYNAPAFDNGTRNNELEFLFDVTYRF